MEIGSDSGVPQPMEYSGGSERDFAPINFFDKRKMKPPIQNYPRTTDELEKT
jgi:hypothetical protein